MTKPESEYGPDPPAYSEGFLKQNYEEVVRSLTKDPSQASLKNFGYTKTSLLHAACYDGKPEIAELLIELGADVNARERDLRTPLHHAANQGHLEVIDLLVRHGADLEAKDAKGMTALMWGQISRSGRKIEIVDKLKGYGATDHD